MSNKVEVIGIDHGWSLIKTVHHVFPSDAKHLVNEPPLRNDILELNGKFYSIGEDRMVVKGNKIEDDDFYLLTLAGIAKELRTRNLREANIYLAVGLPISRYSDEKKGFIQYLQKDKEMSFRYEDDYFNIKIVHVVVFPQCYAAIVSRLVEFKQRVVVVDIGSWTIDIVPIENQKPVNSECISIEDGLIPCMNAIKEKCYRITGSGIDGSIIKHYLRFKDVDLDDEFLKIIDDEVKQYANRVYNLLREYKINVKTTKIIFVGGGAAVMKNFGDHNQKNISYIQDVKANAKGFEYLGILSMRNRRGN